MVVTRLSQETSATGAGSADVDEVDDELAVRLNELDDEVGRALAAGDQAAMSDALRRLADTVRAEGTRLDDTEIARLRRILLAGAKHFGRRGGGRKA